MKKLLSFLLALFFVSLTFSACGTSGNDSQSDKENTSSDSTSATLQTEKESISLDSTSATIQPLISERYVIDVARTPATPELTGFLVQGDFTSYCFYLGRVKTVPLSYGPAERYNGLSDVEITYSNNVVTSESVAKCKSTCFSNTIAHSETTGWSSEFGVEFGIGNDESPIHFQITASHIQSGSKTAETSASKSYNDALETITAFNVSESESRKYTINSNYPADKYYRVTLFGDCDLYAFYIYDTVEKILSYSFEECPVDNTLYYYIDQSDDPYFSRTATASDKISFDSSVVEEIIYSLIESTPSEPIGPITPIKMSLLKESCKVNNGYNPATDGGTPATKLHSRFDMFNLTLSGCLSDGDGKYTVRDKDKFDLTLNLLQNPASLPRGIGQEMGWANFYSYYVTNDSYFGPVCAFDPNNQIDFLDNIGKGACYVTVYLKSGATVNTVSKNNLMDGMNKGDSLSLVTALGDIDPSAIDRIEILVIYELKWEYYDGWWYSGQANWRCVQTIRFK